MIPGCPLVPDKFGFWKTDNSITANNCQFLKVLLISCYFTDSQNTIDGLMIWHELMLKCVLWLTTEKGICFGQINISVGIDKCINSADLNQQVGSFPFVSAEGTLFNSNNNPWTERYFSYNCITANNCHLQFNTMNDLLM